MGLYRLVVLSLLMLISTLLASFAPLHFNFSPTSLDRVSTYSTGLLVGAALTVVIPEGVAAVFESIEHSQEESHEHGGGSSGWIGASLLAGFILMYIIDSTHGHDEYPHPSSSSSSEPHSHSHAHPPSLRHLPSHLSELEPLSQNGHYQQSHSHSQHSSTSSNTSNSEWTITMPQNSSSPPSTEPECPSSRCNHDESAWLTASQSSISTVIGLLAHSLADGISLGASSLSSQNGESTLSSIVFIAIMLHKAPTAFALSTLLSSSASTSIGFIRRALILFSLSAPVGAITTFGILSLFGSNQGKDLGWYTGIALVFSGGTFLFVATHAVTELEGKQEGESKRERNNDELRVGQGRKGRLALILLGMVTPGILSQLVGHGH